MRSSQHIIKLAMISFFVIFLIMLMNTLLSMSETGSFGGLILIGPIPIAFGSSPGISSLMLWTGLILALLYIIISFLPMRSILLEGVLNDDADGPSGSSAEWDGTNIHGSEGSSPGSTVRGGAVIMLGPMPIIIGSDGKTAKTLAYLAMALMLLYFFLFT